MREFNFVVTYKNEDTNTLEVKANSWKHAMQRLQGLFPDENLNEVKSIRIAK